MSIRVGYEPIEAIQKLAILAGKNQAAEREVARQHQLLVQARSMQYEKEMAEFQAKLNITAMQRSMEWELQKMELNSMKDFERDQLRMDALHAREISKEIKQKDEFELIQKQIQEADYLTPEQKTQAMDRVILQRYGYNPNIIPRQEEDDPVKIAMQKLLEGSQQGVAGMTGTQSETPTTQQGLTKLQTQAEKSGKLLVLSPDGEKGMIPISEWKEKKAQGYKLYDIEALQKRPKRYIPQPYKYPNIAMGL